MKKQFTIGQKLIWHVRDFENEYSINATITEVYQDHYIAKTEDNMTLLIDSDNEMEFVDFR